MSSLNPLEDNEIINRFDFKKTLTTFSKSLPVFVIFLLFASALWVLMKLNKQYEVQIKFPISYTNYPIGLISNNSLPKNLYLTIVDNGFTIFKYQISTRFYALNLNIESLINDGNSKSGFSGIISNNQLRKSIIAQLSNSTQLIDITPESLVLTLTQLARKRVKVEIDYQISPKQQFMISGSIRSTPDSVEIYGPQYLLDTIQSVKTELLSLENVSKTTQKVLDLKIIEGIDVASKKVNVTIPIETFTQKSFKTTVNCLNCPDSISIRTFPGIVDVVANVTISSFNTITPEMFNVYVDYNEAKNNSRGVLMLHASTTKKWIEKIKMVPEKVDYLLEIRK